MSTLYCGKQAKAMGDYVTERAKSKMDAAIDAEETRDELIAARAQEIQVRRMLDMAPIDIVAGLQSATEGAASVMRNHLLAGNMEVFGVMARALIHVYIEQDSESIAKEWVTKIEREAKLFGDMKCN